MRRIIRPTFALAAMLITAVTFVISSCEDDNNTVIPESKTPYAPSGQASDITFYTADITGKLDVEKDILSQSEFGLFLSKSDDVMAINSTKYPIKDFAKDYSFTLSLSELDSVTTYYYRSYIYYDGNYFYSDIKNFTTKSPLDVIKTGSLESDSCTVKTLIESKNLLDYIQEYGISYGLNKAPIASKDSTVTTGVIESDGKFTLSMRNIPYDTIVNYRAFVKVKDQIYYGPVLSFEGNTVRTGTINITDYTIISHLKINDNYKELGICYGIDSIPLVSNQKVSMTVLNDSNNYKLKLVDIPFDTIVYYRAYVNTGSDIVYGDIKSFGGNTVTTGVIDTLTFQVQSSVRFNDGITEYGICYSTSDNPNIYDQRISTQEISADNTYTLSLTDIPFGTVYYRAYVMKGRTIYYSDVRYFEGNRITTGDFNEETLSAAASVKFSNNYTYLDLGICYGEGTLPTISDKKVSTSSLNADNSYELELRNIPFGTVYYRAYMMVNGYPQYGAVKCFEGNRIETGDFEDITLVAKGSLRIGKNYDELVLGICYGNNEQPTINDKRVYTNTIDSLNVFSVNLTDIPFGKVYYRTFMALDGNIYYGNVKQFEGNAITTGTINVDSLFVTSSILISNGYNKLELGVCYSNNKQPTVNDKKVTTNTVDSVNSFVLQLSDIPFGRVYYCSYMMLDGIAHYGEIMSFEGNEIITGTIDSVLNVRSKIKYNQRFYTKPITYGICYGYYNNPTINDISVTTNEIGDKKEYELALTNIIYGTTYYYRAFVNVDGEMQYGSVKSFYLEWPVAVAVDLGLSVNWASFNVGASKPEEYGYYYSWGETEYKSVFYSNNYKWWNESSQTLNKYNTSGRWGTVDNKTLLDSEDDVAHEKWGDSWWIPTNTEFEELRTKCIWTWATINGINGYYITSTIEGYKDRSLFLPAAGSMEGDKIYFDSSRGCYWTSSLRTDYADGAYWAYFTFFESGFIKGSHTERKVGLSIRPVCQSESWLASSTIELSETIKTVIPNKSFNLVATVKHNDEYFDKKMDWKSDNPSVAIVDVNGKVQTKSKGTAHITASYLSLSAQCTVVVGEECEITHEYVDLGLSVNWATYNVGAISEDDYGDYYAWGETVIKETYDWSTYKWGNNYNSIIKYNTNSYYGTVDDKITLDLEDDVAHVKWGGNWRMPTKDEQDELRNECTWTWTTLNGIKGYLVTSNKTDYLDRSLFLPAGGGISISSIYDVGVGGNYRGSMLLTGDPTENWCICFNSNVVATDWYSRISGSSVRPVCPK